MPVNGNGSTHFSMSEDLHVGEYVDSEEQLRMWLTFNSKDLNTS